MERVQDDFTEMSDYKIETYLGRKRINYFKSLDLQRLVKLIFNVPKDRERKRHRQKLEALILLLTCISSATEVSRTVHTHKISHVYTIIFNIRYTTFHPQKIRPPKLWCMF